MTTATKTYGKRGSLGFRWQRWSSWYLTPVRSRRSRIGMREEYFWELFIFGVRVVTVATERGYGWDEDETVARVLGVPVYKRS